MGFKVLAFLFFSFLAASSNGVYADEGAKEHGHKTPHGGVVQEAEGMHAEFLIDKSGELRLYLYDKAMKPLGRGDFQTRLAVKVHDGSQHTRDLKSSGNPKVCTLFKGEPIKGLKDWDTAVASLKIKDGWTHIRFSQH